MDSLFHISVGRWHPSIGDPSFMGWFTVFAYFTAALLCGICAFQTRHVPYRRSKRENTLWWFFTIALLFLGINKQLDLQSCFTEIGRIIARSQNWYEHRRVIQFRFIVIFSITCVIMLTVFVMSMRKIWQKYWLELFGLIFIVIFVIIRAASFHHVDVFLKFRLAGLKMNWVLELSGIGCMVAAALLNFYRIKRHAVQ